MQSLGQTKYQRDEIHAVQKTIEYEQIKHKKKEGNCFMFTMYTNVTLHFYFSGRHHTSFHYIVKKQHYVNLTYSLN